MRAFALPYFLRSTTRLSRVRKPSRLTVVLHGIAQALSRFEPVLRTTVKREGFLTRDSRVVERKKYGKAKARKSFQFSKR